MPHQTDETFLDAYLACALWASTDPYLGEPLDDAYTPADFAPVALAQAAEECERFQAENAAALAVCYDRDGYTEALAGHDFFLTRNGHGSGFWDGDIGEPEATRLTDAAHAYGESQPYPGDDGLLYWT